jgi:hypothetical protein
MASLMGYWSRNVYIAAILLSRIKATSRPVTLGGSPCGPYPQDMRPIPWWACGVPISLKTNPGVCSWILAMAPSLVFTFIVDEGAVHCPEFGDAFPATHRIAFSEDFVQIPFNQFLGVSGMVASILTSIVSAREGLFVHEQIGLLKKNNIDG